ncbi:RING-H2 finger protein ATL11-like [Silene latifolia]|uniref:RING-H2 finger protein ATL11-like n=1 Tax=Silene latifolia TaxID=37657 RepID=UPI003D77DE82
MGNSFSGMNIAIYVAFTLLFTLWTISVICRRYRTYHGAPAPFHPVAQPQVALGVFPTNQQLPHGLDVSIIESFPKFQYGDQVLDSKKGNMMKTTDECGVCLGVFQEKEMVRLLPKCGHVFHADCVDPWLRSHATCPLCRDNLLPSHLSGEMAHRADYRVNVDQGRG